MADAPLHEKSGPGAQAGKHSTETAHPIAFNEKGNTMSTPQGTPRTTAPAGFTPEYELTVRDDGTVVTTDIVAYWTGPSMDSDQLGIEAAWTPESGLHFLSADGSIRTLAELRQLASGLTGFVASWDALTAQPEHSSVAADRRRRALLVAITRADRHGPDGFVQLYQDEFRALEQAAAREGGPQ